MNRLTPAVAVALLATGSLAVALAQPAADKKPPQPRAVTPGLHAAAPSDAIVLFSGTSTDGWTTMDGAPTKWAIENGSIGCTPGSGPVISEHKINDCQLHIEFMCPAGQTGAGQDLGNSGVYLQGRYEVQVLNSYKNETYPDGQCGAVYGKHAPLVNACRPGGEWQSYDIVFRAPRFDAAGKKLHDARVTVLHNGVLIQDNVAIDSPTTAAPFPEAPGDGPIYLQDHGHPVRYRNIWVRPL
jgi:hypothetical protein